MIRAVATGTAGFAVTLGYPAKRRLRGRRSLQHRKGGSSCRTARPLSARCAVHFDDPVPRLDRLRQFEQQTTNQGSWVRILSGAPMKSNTYLTGSIDDPALR
jgi:hypothetical protein